MSGHFIICAACGYSGKAGYIFKQDKSEKTVFMHLGHDPYRGNMHYHCPSCGALLSVAPMAMLESSCVRGIPCHYEPMLFSA